MSHKCALKVGSLNIEGAVGVKYNTPEIQKLIHNHDIICFLESWLGPHDACPNIDGYIAFRSERKKHRKAKRNSGGILVYCKQEISGGISKISTSHSDIMWLKLDRSYFGLDQDIYMCMAYIIPETSPHRDDFDIFEELNKDIEIYSSRGYVALLGDLNSRVGTKIEQHYGVNPDNSGADLARPLAVPPRYSEDKHVNSNGRKLLQLLTNHDLLIANGRTCGDLSGKYTCRKYNGDSVNDMFVTHRDFLEKIIYFKVGEFDWYSDHAHVSLAIKVNVDKSKNMPKYWRRVTRLIQKWNAATKSRFIDMLTTEDNKSRMDTFCKTTFNDSNSLTKEFTSILQDVVRKTFPRKERKRKSTEHINRIEYSYECELAKRMFKKAQREFRKDKNNLNRRQIYILEKRKYKKVIYKTVKLAKENKLHKLSAIEQADPKTFWRNIKDMIKPRDDVVKNIDPDKWSDHFRNLLQTPPAGEIDRQFHDYVKESMTILEQLPTNSEELNKDITIEELNKTVKRIKTGKSVYLDDISNDAIKCGINHMDKCLLHLYNTVLKLGHFPDMWGESLIIPLHKNGDKFDVTNYRGIMISSCVGKIFLRILTDRIDRHMREMGKWCINQCGFKKDHRTEDNLFILQTVYNSYVENQNQNIYIAFVDFSKFFDKINRELLRYKLLKYGVTGQVYKIIKSMYSNTPYRTHVGGHISPVFHGNNGVKQGCVISPLLSNIFQNDLHEIFMTPDCDPIALGTKILNSLSWADDLILMSRSKAGLQRCLDKLRDYCVKWGLEVNVTKTKTMVFAKRSTLSPKFYFGKTHLECVGKYNYLGFHISGNGKFSNLIKDRVLKSTRVSYLVLQALSTNGNVSAKLSMSIFDKQILPIILYGCAIWSLPQSCNLLYIHEQPEGANTRTVVRNVLNRLCPFNVNFKSARRIGRAAGTQPRKILVKLSNFEDKEYILRQGSPFITNFERNTPYKIEKVHSDFCKRTLNVSKYASTTAVMGELGRYPIMHNAWSHSIKYWLRLHRGTHNVLLNEAFGTVSTEKHEWLQSIQYLLCTNGLKNIWLNPHGVNADTFHKTFRRRLDDQYSQSWIGKINDSGRFSVLSTLKTDMTKSLYIDKIRNPQIRKTFTRLRTDMNVLNCCKYRVNPNATAMCSACVDEPESVQHFLFHCNQFTTMRANFYSRVSEKCGNFCNMSDNQKIKFVLNLDCPHELEGACCKFVYEIYSMRENMRQNSS